MGAVKQVGLDINLIGALPFSSLDRRKNIIHPAGRMLCG
jgi:hypothetical protein